MPPYLPSHTQPPVPQTADERRVISLREWRHPASGQMRAVAASDYHGADAASRASAPLHAIDLTQQCQRRPEEAGRHYLKFMLPAIPVAAFVMAFLYFYLSMSSASASAGTALNPAVPLVGAALLAITTGLLCAITYLGYLRVSERPPV